ncbi:MAG: tetratricopeptide repeat protein [Brumimicrobium sp.]|nr:tetratricopeptide repeat protein [Brumimicrobium sp.]
MKLLIVSCLVSVLYFLPAGYSQQNWLKNQNDSLAKIWFDQNTERSDRALALIKILSNVEKIDNKSVFRKYTDSLIRFTRKESLGNNLGDAYYIKSFLFNDSEKSDSALIYLNKALEIKLKYKDKAMLSKVYTSLATVYSQNMRSSEAIDAYINAIQIEKKLNNKERLAGLYNNLGNQYNQIGEVKQAVHYFMQALRIYEKTGYEFGAQNTLMNVGNLYYHQADYKTAKEYYSKALRICEENNFESEMTSHYLSLGNVYQMNGELDSAEILYLKGLETVERFPNKYDEGILYNNLGNLYLEIGEEAYKHGNLEKRKKYLDEAVDYHLSALNIQKEIEDKEGMSYSLSSIAEVYFKRKEFEKALEYGHEALNIAQETESSIDVKYVSYFLYEVYKEIGKSARALEMYELYNQALEKINNESNKQELLKQRLHYEYDKKAFKDSLRSAQEKEFFQKELEVSDLKLKNEQSIRYSLIFGVVLLVLFAGVMVNRFRATKKKNRIIEAQKKLVEHKNKEITDSINYAKRLQEAILPPTKLISSYLLESFILYKPKDIVAGDFYFMDVIQQKDRKLIYYAAADCTGHGVPGAIVSIVGANGLKRCIQELSLRDPGEILDMLSLIVAENFSQSEQRIRDGMDIALCCLEMVNDKAVNLHYAGANIPLVIVNPQRSHWPEDLKLKNLSGIGEIKPNRQAVSYSEKTLKFDTYSLPLETGDALYSFSDGFADQFGGNSPDDRESGGKKFKSITLKKQLLAIHDKNMEEQKKILNEIFHQWKGDLEQVDDVCIIGVRV